MSSPESLTSMSTLDNTLPCSCSSLIGLSRIANPSGVFRRLTEKKWSVDHTAQTVEQLIKLINATFPELRTSQHQLITLLSYQPNLV